MIFRFAQPEAFLLLFVLLVFFIWRRQRQRPQYMTYSDTRLVAGLPLSWRWRWRWLPNALTILSLISLIIAIARPQSGFAEERIESEGLDIVLTVDISRSMDAMDLGEQNRLETAKDVIADFIDGREFDRIGLVVFAHDAYHLVPPTRDYRTLFSVLNEVKLASDLSLTDGTAIGIGLASAANMMRESAAASQVIILLTDGENTVGQIAPETAALAVSAMGVRIYTIGIGTAGENLRLTDSKGDPIFIRNGLDETSLQLLAAIGSGQYFRAKSLLDLQSVYTQIDDLEKTPFSRSIQINWQDQPQLPLLFALGSLLIGRLLRETFFWMPL